MSTDSRIMNYVVRMVVPMRREFGRSLDVRQFLHDGAYAREVVEQALQSNDARLIEYARYVQEHLLGARSTAPRAPAAAPVAPVAPAAAPVANPVVAAAPAPDATAADAAKLRTQVLKKYTGGLR